MPKRCGATGKVRYATAIVAGEALERRRRNGIAVTHVYRCRLCRCWHMASDRITIRVAADELELILVALRDSAFDGTNELAARFGRDLERVAAAWRAS